MPTSHHNHDKNPNQTLFIMTIIQPFNVALGFKDKTRYTPYVCLGIQITHIVTNEWGNIKDNALNT